jgi:molybdopterin converting factor small subunit
MIQISFLGSLETAFKRRTDQVECTNPLTISELIELLRERNGLEAEGIPRTPMIRGSVNGTVVGLHHLVELNDHVQFFPLVAGG